MLYELIQSMSRTEKRYFRMGASFMYEKDDQGLMRIFDLISEKKISDDREIKKQAGDRFFAQRKKLLTEKIIDSLVAYHRGKSPESELDHLISCCRILMEKNMHSAAEKKLDRAGRLAGDGGHIDRQIRIGQMKTELYAATGNIDSLRRHLEKMQSEIPHLLEILDRDLIIEKEYLQFVRTNSEMEFIRSAEELKELKKSAEILTRMNGRDLSKKAQSRYYYIAGIYNYLKGDFEESRNCFHRQVQLFDGMIYQTGHEVEKARAMANLALLNLHTMRQGDFEESMAMLELFSSDRQGLDKQNSGRMYLLRLLWLTRSGQFGEAQKHMRDNGIAGREEKNALPVTERNLVMFGHITVHMMTGEYRKALKLVNEFLDNDDQGSKKDMHVTARLLFLFLHEQSGNTEVLESRLESLERYLKQNRRFFGFEKSCVGVIRRLISTESKREKKRIWKEFHGLLEEHASDLFDRNAMVYFDFRRWTGHLISNSGS